MDNVSLAAKHRQIRLDKNKAQLVQYFSRFWKEVDATQQAVQNRVLETQAGLGKRPDTIPPIAEARENRMRAAGQNVEMPYTMLFGGASKGDPRTEVKNRSIIGLVADTYRKQHGRLPSREELNEIFAQNDDLMESSSTFRNTLQSYNPEYYTGNQ